MSNIRPCAGPDGRPKGATRFLGEPNSYVKFPNTGRLDTKQAITILAWVYHDGKSGPIFQYNRRGILGVSLRMKSKRILSALLVSRRGTRIVPISGRRRLMKYKAWNFVGLTYDKNTRMAILWLNGNPIRSKSVGKMNLATNFPARIGSLKGGRRFFRGKVSCVQVYGDALNQLQIRQAKKKCLKKGRLSNQAFLGDF